MYEFWTRDAKTASESSGRKFWQWSHFYLICQEGCKDVVANAGRAKSEQRYLLPVQIVSEFEVQCADGCHGSSHGMTHNVQISTRVLLEQLCDRLGHIWLQCAAVV